MKHKMSFRKTNHRSKKLNISQIITIVFLIVIITGAILLTLPVASRTGKSNGLFTALFTATSATCVTGLALGDTWTQWSMFGQVIILMLIQIGGLGFMSFASIFFFTLRRKIDFEQMLVMAQSIGTENMQDVIRIQKKILFGGMLMETIGAAILAFRFSNWYSIPKSIWLGVFHSVSAFCNAGFDVLGFEIPGGSLIAFNTDSVICITLSVLIIVGGIGFIVWDDLTGWKPPTRWSVYTKLVLIITSVLIIAGTVLFYIIENQNPMTMGNMTMPQKILASFFQSVTTRTAGFAGIDQGAMTETGKIVTVFFMFVGGASGSTAGGLKVGTFLVIMLFLISRMRGKNRVNIFSRRVSQNHITNALSLFGMMTIFCLTGATILCGTSNFAFIDCLFEVASAMGTAGLSTGITSGLGFISKCILIIFMFFGRIGILTLSMGFLQSGKKNEDYSYPDISMPIG